MPVRASAHYGTIPEPLTPALKASDYSDYSRRQQNPFAPGARSSSFCIATHFYSQVHSGYFSLIGSEVSPLT